VVGVFSNHSSRIIFLAFGSSDASRLHSSEFFNLFLSISTRCCNREIAEPPKPNRCGGAIRIVAPPQLEGMVAKHGKTTWKVPNPRAHTVEKKWAERETGGQKPEEGEAAAGNAGNEDSQKKKKAPLEFFESFVSAPTDLTKTGKIRPTMFPPRLAAAGEATTKEAVQAGLAELKESSAASVSSVAGAAGGAAAGERLKDKALSRSEQTLPLEKDAYEERCEQLRNCRRFLPHLMNTGGFFVCIIEKTAELPTSRDARREEFELLPADIQAEIIAKKKANENAVAGQKAAAEKRRAEKAEKEKAAGGEAAGAAASVEASSEETADTPEKPPAAKKLKVDTTVSADVSPTSSSAQEDVEMGDAEGKTEASAKAAGGNTHKKKLRRDEKAADKFHQVAEDSDEWRSIQAFYGLKPETRKFFWKRPAVHGDNKLYAVSEKLAVAVECCQNSESTKVVSCGVRCFQHMDSFAGSCNWRITQDGLSFLNAIGGLEKVELECGLDFLKYILAVRDMRTVDACGIVRPASKAADEKLPAGFDTVEVKTGSPVLSLDTCAAQNRARLVDEEAAEKKWAQAGETEISKDVTEQLAAAPVRPGSYVLYCKEVDLRVVALITRKRFTLYVDKQDGAALLECLKVGRDLRKELGI